MYLTSADNSDLSRRRFLKHAAMLTLGLTTGLDDLFAGRFPPPVEQPFVMSIEQMEAVQLFLLSNRTVDGMPLSFKVVPENYWKIIEHPAFDVAAIIKRLLTTYSLNIYDGACGQIAESLMGVTELADEHTSRLLSGSSGDLLEIRAQDNFTFNGKEVGTGRGQISPSKTWFFRTISDQYLQTDPLDGKIQFIGFPTHPDLHHADWKPLAGEQAWAAIIGPLQVAYIKYGGDIPFTAQEIELAVSILECTEAMQSPIGAIYHAPEGTDGKEPWIISNENNISMYAALSILLEVLEPYENQYRAASIYTRRIKKILYGEGAEHEGIYGYFRDYAFNETNGIFNQGGSYIDGIFIPDEKLAVDVQTWGILVFGPDLIDQWHGEGTAYNIWLNTKSHAGYYDRYGILRGIGFTEGYDVSSAEWGFGAIMMLRSLSDHYYSSHPELSDNLLQDSITMRHGIENELKMALDDGSVSYKYTNIRVTDFNDLRATPIPSLTASAWAIMVDTDYNPFILGGGQPSYIEEAETIRVPERGSSDSLEIGNRFTQDNKVSAHSLSYTHQINRRAFLLGGRSL